MKKQIPCLLLALTLFSINIAPAEAAKRKTKSRFNKGAKKQFVVTRGEWCFELPKLGFFCYQR